MQLRGKASSALSGSLEIPFFSKVIPGGIGYGLNLLVEFEPHTLWYPASLTLAAQALRAGVETDYHTFERFPNEIRKALVALGLDVKKLEETHALAIIDNYTAQTGMALPEGLSPMERSLRLSDWSIFFSKAIKPNALPEKDRPGVKGPLVLHIDDDLSVLGRYNKEVEIIDMWRTRVIPYARVSGAVFMHSILAGTHSESFYKQMESLCDGIIDFKSEEAEEELRHLMRIRSMRAGRYISRWQRLQLLDNGEVTPVDEAAVRNK